MSNLIVNAVIYVIFDCIPMQLFIIKKIDFSSIPIGENLGFLFFTLQTSS